VTGTFPITPPPELVQQWEEQFLERPRINGYFIQPYIATQAAQWGADQELDACCIELTEKIITNSFYEGDKTHSSWRELASIVVRKLRAARRPKPPNLKEQALKALGPEPLPGTGPTGDTILNKGSIERHRCIRRALESLND
jgi:hypothetical protein